MSREKRDDSFFWFSVIRKGKRGRRGKIKERIDKRENR